MPASAVAPRPVRSTSASRPPRPESCSNLIRGLPVKRADEVLQFSDREVSQRHPQGARQRRRQRPAQRRAGSRRAVRQGLLRRRGPDAEAVHAPCPRPRQPHQQAHLPHHHRGRPSRRRQARDRPGPRGQAHRRRSSPPGSRWHRRQPPGTRRAQPSACRRSTRRQGRRRPRPRRTSSQDVAEPTKSSTRTMPRSTTMRAEGYEIKGNADSMLYHVPGHVYNRRRRGVVRHAEDAEAAGTKRREPRREARRRVQTARAPATSRSRASRATRTTREPTEWARRSIPTGSVSASPPTGRAAGSPSATTRNISPRTGRSARR